MTKAKQVTSTKPLGDHKRKLEDEVDWLKGLMVAIVVVLFVGFAGVFVATAAMMVDAVKDNRGSTNDFSNQIRAQNEKIDLLTKKLNEQEATQNSN